MVDPTRKKRQATTPNGLDLVDGNPPPASPLRIVTAHLTRPGILDLNEFAVGTLNRATNHPRNGVGFNGRPTLVAELAPYYRVLFATAPKSAVNAALHAIRQWWRLFDRLQDLAPVSEAAHINELHCALAVREGIRRRDFHWLMRPLNLMRNDAGLPDLHVELPRDPQVQSELPDKKAIAAIYQDLKFRLRASFSRFEAADTLAASGRVLDPLKTAETNITEGDVHATYRAYLKASGKHYASDVPGLRLMRKYTSELNSLALPVFGLYPRKADVQAALLLFLIKTGWNAQTAIDLDVKGSWLRPHPTSPQHHLVVSTKSRGNTEQIAVGLEKSELSPGRIVQRLLERTRPLRAFIEAELDTEQKKLQKIQSDEQYLKVAKLRRVAQSPWLFVDCTRKNAILALDLNTYRTIQHDPVLRRWIRERNEREQARISTQLGKIAYLVSEAITISDFREAFIAFSYEGSGYNWLVAKLAAGHTSIESLKTYLRKRQWKAYGERQVASFQEAMWSEIRNRRIVDPAILRGLVERGVVTEVQRLRWSAHKDRTRVGTGCKDFQNPPIQISPEHVKGCGCRVQRCTLCPHAIVFEDSLEHLARRMAELEVLQGQVPLTAWYQSTFPEEVEATRTTLELFEPKKVDAVKKFWLREIQDGRHVVLQFEGIYE